MNLRTGNKNTIEFRAHGATHEAEKAKRCVNFLTAFVEASAANRAPKSFMEDRPPEHKFEKMFEWVRACRRTAKLDDTYTHPLEHLLACLPSDLMPATPTSGCPRALNAGVLLWPRHRTFQRVNARLPGTCAALPCVFAKGRL